LYSTAQTTSATSTRDSPEPDDLADNRDDQVAFKFSGDIDTRQSAVLRDVLLSARNPRPEGSTLNSAVP
jgi:hypothetical protein